MFVRQNRLHELHPRFLKLVLFVQHARHVNDRIRIVLIPLVQLRLAGGHVPLLVLYRSLQVGHLLEYKELGVCSQA